MQKYIDKLSASCEHHGALIDSDCQVLLRKIDRHTAASQVISQDTDTSTTCLGR